MPDPDNPRSHGPEQIRRLADSIAAFGFNVPVVVDRRLRILAGHGRVLAAQRLGWAEVPTIRIEHLSEVEARAFAIADNRLAELAEWDEKLLAEQLRALVLEEPDFAIEATGFDLEEIEPRPGAGATPRRRAVARRGDVWLLGPHRLVCGDGAGIERMLLGEEALVVVAEPGMADAILRRWQARTGGAARHAQNGRVFAL